MIGQKRPHRLDGLGSDRSAAVEIAIYQGAHVVILIVSLGDGFRTCGRAPRPRQSKGRARRGGCSPARATARCPPPGTPPPPAILLCRPIWSEIAPVKSWQIPQTAG